MARHPGWRVLAGQARQGVLAPFSDHLATKDAALMTEYRDLDVLLVRGRSQSNQIEQLANEQQGDRTTHSDDRGRCTAMMVSGRIVRLHPSGSTGCSFSVATTSKPSFSTTSGTTTSIGLTVVFDSKRSEERRVGKEGR